MLPCPYCQCPEVYVAPVEDGMCCVACPRCGMSGPISVDGDEDEAARGWEILCRKMCRNCRQVYIQRIITLRKQLCGSNGTG